MYNILINSDYKLPQLAPDGNYCPNLYIGDLNGDGVVNILDVVSLVNIVLSNTYIIEADINSDGVNNILDIVLLANCVLAQDCANP